MVLEGVARFLTLAVSGVSFFAKDPRELQRMGTNEEADEKEVLTREKTTLLRDKPCIKNELKQLRTKVHKLSFSRLA